MHHARAARVAIERDRRRQAEYWISALRDYGLSLASRRRGLPTRFGRGFDDLPAGVLAAFEPALVRAAESDELRRALAAAVDAVLGETAEVEELARRLEPPLRRLAGA